MRIRQGGARLHRRFAIAASTSREVYGSPGVRISSPSSGDGNHVLEIKPVVVDGEHQLVRHDHARPQHFGLPLGIIEPHPVELPRLGSLWTEQRLRRAFALRRLERRRQSSHLGERGAVHPPWGPRAP